MRKLRLGIIGAGWMAGMCCEGIAETDHLQAEMVYARRLSAAQEFAARYHLPACTDNLDEMLRSDTVDAVYIATTNETHLSLALQAVEAGKPVLVEKPFTLNYKEARQLVDAARRQGVFVMEAMWSRFIPGMLMAAELVRSGMFGNLSAIHMQTGCVLTPEKNGRVYDLSRGGGALVDIGVYALSILEMLVSQTPARVINRMSRAPASGVDIRDELTLVYSSGVRADILVTCEEELPTTLLLEGGRGSLALDSFVQAQQLIVTQNGRTRYYDFSGNRYRYAYQLEHFARCVLEGEAESYIFPLDCTLRVMRTMDACRFAAGYLFPGEEQNTVLTADRR